MWFLTYQPDTSEQTFLMVWIILTYQFGCRGGGKTHFPPPLEFENWQFRESIPGPNSNFTGRHLHWIFVRLKPSTWNLIVYEWGDLWNNLSDFWYTNWAEGFHWLQILPKIILKHSLNFLSPMLKIDTLKNCYIVFVQRLITYSNRT